MGNTMSKITFERNVMQPGRGIFSSVYFRGTVVAEKHDGQTVTPILQQRLYDCMQREGIPVSDKITAIDWNYAAGLLV